MFFSGDVWFFFLPFSFHPSPFLCLFCLCVCLSVFFSPPPSPSLSACLSLPTSLSLSVSVYSSFFPSVYLSLPPSPLSLPACLSLSLFVSLSLSLNVYVHTHICLHPGSGSHFKNPSTVCLLAVSMWLTPVSLVGKPNPSDLRLMGNNYLIDWMD